jgi:hypothetical protein
MKAFMTDSVVRSIAMTLVVVMGVVSLVPRVEASFVPSDQSSAANFPAGGHSDDPKGS